MNFAQNLKALRKRNRITQNGLASALKLTQQTIGKWEVEGAEPSIKTLCTLADYFHVTTDQLLGRAPLPDTNERKEGKSVKRDTIERLEECLLAFVERVAKGGATTEVEVQVLPAVAQVLASLRIG